MLRAIIRNRFTCAALFPFSSFSENNSDERNSLQNIRNIIEDHKHNFYDYEGNPTKELQSVLHTTIAGGITGFMLGAVIRISPTIETFKAENQATLFRDKFEPKRQIQIKLALNMLKGGFPMGVKLGTICFLFSSISTYLYVTRNKFDVLNYVISGAIVGTLWKINMGLKGMFAGFILGSILGIISGIIVAIILYVSGKKMDDIYEANNRIAAVRREKLKNYTRLQVQKEQEELVKLDEENLKAIENKA